MAKENLLWKISVIESQLNDKEGSEHRLQRAQLAAEKKARKRSESQTLDDNERQRLEQELVALRQKYVDQKVYHGIIVVQKALKSALTVEALKIQKRIKGASGDATKVAGLNGELAATKAFKHDELAPTIAVNAVWKSYLKMHQQSGSDALLKTAFAQKATLDGFSHEQKNVFGRLCNTGPVKKAIDQLVSSVKVATGAQSKKSKVEEKPEKLAKAEVKLADEKADKGAEGEEVEDEDNEEATNYDHLIAGSSDEDEGSDEEGSEEGSEAEGDDFFEGDSGLPSLATGYISGSDDDGYDYENDSKVKEVTMERKNRRGQRARRKIWEMKYGSGAKHVQQEQKKKQEEFQQRQTEYEQREARRQQMAAANGGVMPDRRKRIPVEERPVHPSWEAKKKLSAVPKFEGKKIKF